MTNQNEVTVETPADEGFTPAPLEQSIDATGGLNTDMFTKPFKMIATVEVHLNVVTTKDGTAEVTNIISEKENVVFDAPMGIVNEATLLAVLNTGAHKAKTRVTDGGIPENIELAPNRAVLLGVFPLGPQTDAEFNAR